MFYYRCVGEAGSYVYGAITDGVFRGRIELPSSGDSYQVERIEYYASSPSSSDTGDLLLNDGRAHSVIYHDSSVDVDAFYR